MTAPSTNMFLSDARRHSGGYGLRGHLTPQGTCPATDRRNLTDIIARVSYQTKQREHRIIEFSQFNNTLFTAIFDGAMNYIRRVLSIDIKIKQGDGIVTFADLEEEGKTTLLKNLEKNILTSNDIEEGSNEDVEFFLILDFSEKDLSTDEELGEDVIFYMDSEIPQEVYDQASPGGESEKMDIDVVVDAERRLEESTIFRLSSSVESSSSSGGR